MARFSFIIKSVYMITENDHAHLFTTLYWQGDTQVISNFQGII